MQPSSLGLRLRQAGFALLCFYFLAGVIFCVVLKPGGHFADEKEFLSFSHHLLYGPGFSMDGVHLTASRPPGYAFFLAFFMALGSGITVIQIVQYLLVVATILLVYGLCKHGTRFPGLLLVVTGLVTIYPLIFYTSATLYPQTLAAFLFMLSIFLLMIPKRNFLLNLATGLSFSALTLVVPTFALTVIVALAIAWMLRLIRIRDAAVILPGVLILIICWTARNEIVFHQFVPLASNSGENFLIGNCENTIPYGGSGNVDRTRYVQETKGMNEFEADHYYRQAAIQWITQNPVRAGILYLEKTANYFNVYNEFAPENKAEVSFWKQAVLGLSYATLLALLAWRLLDTKRFPLSTREKFLLLVYVLSAFTMAIFVTRIRYRMPYDYLIIGIIAMHLSNRLAIWLRLESKQESR